MKTKTLNMPKTDFSQRSNSQELEPRLLKLWEKVFEESNSLNNPHKRFVLHDGPPYANGDVHVGHVLNKVLKDMVSKFHLMSGEQVDFRPGFDCHGLPTELGVQKKFGRSLPTSELREKCKEWANTYTEKQKSTFKSLGVLADWDKSYQTMSKEYEVKQLEVLYHLLKSGKVYLDKRPVYYSPSSQTVLAESELEYKSRKDKSAYFTLPMENGTNLLVWTTQPWTLLGNKAVCVNPEMEYYLVESEDNQKYVTNNLDLFYEYRVLHTYLGKDLEFKTYLNPLTKESGVVVCDKFVKSGSGTGLVHLCPGHGEDDYEVCQRYGLVGKDLTDQYGKVNGKFCLDECSDEVLTHMQDLGMLFQLQEFEHSYPHDWRTGGPVYYKLTEQFFLDLTDVQESATKALDNVHFSEERWKNRLVSMTNSRSRWCLSRQRKWGFPLAVFLKEGKLFLDGELEAHLLELFKEKGSNVWFDLTESELLPEKFQSLGLKKCDYTLDVWFDSGVSWLSVLNGEQADVYFEGSDQHRGWFQSSLLTSVAMSGRAPYKRVVTHGFVLDDKGRKMSKSLGNVVEPKTVQGKYNTDVLRLWTAVVNYGDDVSLGDAVLKTCGEYYFKLRNTMKYLLGNLYGFDPNLELVMGEKELVALNRCEEMYQNAQLYYTNYDVRRVFEELMKWVAEFSSQYLDVETKSFLYESDLDSLDRQRCQFVLNYCTVRFMKVVAPMCSFLAEDAYQHYEFKNKKSVFFERF